VHLAGLKLRRVRSHESWFVTQITETKCHHGSSKKSTEMVTNQIEIDSPAVHCSYISNSGVLIIGKEKRDWKHESQRSSQANKLKIRRHWPLQVQTVVVRKQYYNHVNPSI
jgi:hypothetical protein